MTSNIGGKRIQELNEAKKSFEYIEKEIKSMLKDYFKPEFLNRIDEIILFRNLSKEDLMKIVDIQIKYVNKNLSNKKLSITLTQAAKKYLIEKGYDPSFGARPLKRVIQQNILNDLAAKVLSGDFKENDKIKIDVDKKKGLIFEN